MSIVVRNNKLRLGLIYGIVAGGAFALFAWGLDALMLARANASFFWVKFVPGLLLSSLAGGIASWLTMRVHKHSYAILFWGLLAALFAWLVVWLPLNGSAVMIKLLDPALSSQIRFSSLQDIGQFRLVSLLIIGLACLVCGLLELNLVDQAAVSPYISGSLGALLVCIILLGLVGSAADQMINTSLREPVLVVNDLLQFAQDNVGVDVPKATARQWHLSATRNLGELVQKSRQLTLIGFDENLGIVDVLVDFAGTQVKCSTIYAQPTDCIILTSKP